MLKIWHIITIVLPVCCESFDEQYQQNYLYFQQLNCQQFLFINDDIINSWQQ